MGLKAKGMPAPRWKATAWLSMPGQSIGPDVAAELRMSMFRRLEAVVVSGIITPLIALLALHRHPGALFKIWLLSDLVIFVLRSTLVFHVMRRLKYGKIGCFFGPRATDLYIIAGTVWTAIFGYGSLIVMMTGDMPLMMTTAFAGAAILGALCVRNPSSPRQNTVQMSLILLPFSIGCFVSRTPLISWYILVGPIYLLTLVNMSRQIHDDYIAMLIAQLENGRRALHCALTGLPNRSFFDKRLSESLRDAAPSHLGLSVLCIDLDGFKAVNDQFGHPMGDMLLVHVGQRLQRLLRPTDIVARLGGDEFAILMQSDDRADAARLALRINRTMAEPFVLSSNTTVTIGASVGIRAIETAADLVDADQIMVQADAALYAAKHAGKGTFRRCDAAGIEVDATAPMSAENWRLAG